MTVVEEGGFPCAKCTGTGRINAGWLSQGEVCSACNGRGRVSRRQHACVHCAGSGEAPSSAVLALVRAAATCPACCGAGHITFRQIVCRRCRATGVIYSMYGLFSTECRACCGRRYVRREQETCQVCVGAGAMSSEGFFRFFRANRHVLFFHLSILFRGRMYSCW